MNSLIRVNSFSRFTKFMPAVSSDLRLRRLFGSGAALGHGLVELGLVFGHPQARENAEGKLGVNLPRPQY
jgi:hypothetical protein